MRLIPLYKLKIPFRGCGETFCTCVLFTLCELVTAFGSAVVKCPKCCYSSKSCSNARGYHCTLLHFDQGCKITWTVCFSRLFLREYRVTSVLQKRNFFYAKKINEASQILLNCGWKIWRHERLSQLYTRLLRLRKLNLKKFRLYFQNGLVAYITSDDLSCL